MTKKQLFIITVLFLIPAISNSLHANALYYTFEGVYRDAGCGFSCSRPIPGLAFGDTVSYTFLVDNEPLRTVVNEDNYGSLLYYFSHSARLVSGTALMFEDETHNVSSSDDYLGIFTAYIGYNSSGQNVGADFSFYGYALNGGITIYSYQGGDFPDNALDSYDDFIAWAVGNITSEDNILRLQNDEGDYYSVPSIANLTLTNISEISPSSVPEPGSILLVGFGFFTMSIARKVSKKSGSSEKSVVFFGSGKSPGA